MGLNSLLNIEVMDNISDRKMAGRVDGDSGSARDTGRWKWKGVDCLFPSSC